MGYMSNFIVYLFAMLGIIVLALVVYKKFNVNSLGIKSNHSLKIEDALSISARKTLYVIRSGSERFLIAADYDNTTLISKLEDNNIAEFTSTPISREQIRPRTIREIKKADLSENAIRMQDNVSPIRKPIMKEIKAKLNF